jgi:hypothetical protein
MPGRKVVAVVRDIFCKLMSYLKVVDILCSLHLNYPRYTYVFMSAIIFFLYYVL